MEEINKTFFKNEYTKLKESKKFDKNQQAFYKSKDKPSQGNSPKNNSTIGIDHEPGVLSRTLTA
jgi:hypothetical protein